VYFIIHICSILFSQFYSSNDKFSNKNENARVTLQATLVSWRHKKQPLSTIAIGRIRTSEPIVVAVCPQWSRKLFPAILLFSKISRLDFQEDAVGTKGLWHFVPSDRCIKDAVRMRLRARGYDEEQSRWVSRNFVESTSSLVTDGKVAETETGETREYMRKIERERERRKRE